MLEGMHKKLLHTVLAAVIAAAAAFLCSAIDTMTGDHPHVKVDSMMDDDDI